MTLHPNNKYKKRRAWLEKRETKKQNRKKIRVIRNHKDTDTKQSIYGTNNNKKAKPKKYYANQQN